MSTETIDETTEEVEESVPSAEIDDDVVIDEVEETEAEEAEPSQEEATEETVEEPEAEVKENVEQKEEKPKIPFERFEKRGRKIKELVAKIEQLESKVTQPKQEQVNDGPPVRPSEKDYDYDQEKYQAALEKYEDDRLEYKLNQRVKEQEAQKQAEKVKELQENFRSNAEKLFNEDREYQEALQQAYEDDDDLSIPPMISEVLLESEVGHMIERELVVNRDELLPRLKGMNQRQQLIELGRIEGRILSSMGNNKQETKKTAVASKAPKPPAKIGGGSTKVSADAELKKLYKDFSIE